jgi:5-hydroxyisourate hydrolase
MSAISTHVLDTSRGQPAAGVSVVLELYGERAEWRELARGITDREGRRDLMPGDWVPLTGIYRLTFDTGTYFQRLGLACFYPSVTVVFEIRAPSEDYHVPLLLSPFGYSTYRGQ